MKTIKVSPFQLFSLIYLFELGSALLVGIGSNTKQDAWIVMLIGLMCGLILVLIYHRLFLYYPDLPLTSYIKQLTGKFLGRILGFIYIIYFIYDASRVLRDFGELLTTTIYTNTPLIVINMLMILICIYALHKGLEVLGRVSEIFFIVVFLMSILAFFLILFSGIIHLENLEPILEDGYTPVLKTSLNQSILYPFGEMIVFSMILPQINESKKAKNVCLSAILLSGIDLVIVTIINIASLGVDAFVRSPFPLFSTIRKIVFFRFDVFFMLQLVIGGFLKITIFFYAAVTAVADVFRLKVQSNVIFPIGLVILFASMAIASNSAEHFQEGFKIGYLYWTVEIIIPILLFLIAYFRNKKKPG